MAKDTRFVDPKLGRQYGSFGRTLIKKIVGTENHPEHHSWPMYLASEAARVGKTHKEYVEWVEKQFCEETWRKMLLSDPVRWRKKNDIEFPG